MTGVGIALAVGAALALMLGCGVELEPPSVAVPIGPADPAPTTATVVPEAAGEMEPPPATAIALTPALRFTLTVFENPADIPKYDRGDWTHWIDQDGDCQDARQETLVAESEEPVAYKSPDRCRVESGRWTDPYTGTVVTAPGDLDVDHLVPLANAHRSGGWAWSKQRKRAYANDLAYSGHLVATTARANRAKGSDGPEEWRPSDEGYWCVYATDWASIKSRWDLWVTADELAALREMLDTCAEPVGLDVTHRDGTPGPVGSAGGDLPTATPAPESPRYDPAGPDRDCGDFDTWDEAQAFFIAAGGPDNDPHRLDQGGDGVPCESLPGAP